MLFIVFKTQAQDVEFSQYLNNPIYLNPALAGTKIGPRIILNYRNQWPALNKAFTTYSVSFDQDFEKIGGLSFQVMSDNQDNKIYTSLSVSGGYNYAIKLSKNTAIRLGLQASFLQKRIDWSSLLFRDQFSLGTALPTYSTGEQLPDYSKRTNLDVAGGFLLYSKKTYLGLAFKHITQPNESFYQSKKSALPTRIALNFGAEIKTKKNNRTYISPNVMYVVQGKFKQISAQMLINKEPLIVGLGLRHAIKNTDAVIFYFGIKVGVFKTIYSYDNTFSNLRGKTGGAHEISIAFNFADSKKEKRRRALKNSVECPTVF